MAYVRLGLIERLHYCAELWSVNIQCFSSFFVNWRILCWGTVCILCSIVFKSLCDIGVISNLIKLLHKSTGRDDLTAWVSLVMIKKTSCAQSEFCLKHAFLCFPPSSCFQRSHHRVHSGCSFSDPAGWRPHKGGGQEPVWSSDRLCGYRQGRWHLLCRVHSFWKW